MSSVMHRHVNPKAASLTSCAPTPRPCSTCGQLECLCRPRFFAGQVLTADDLNRLDYYIRAKHRLHNRQLHGWGVVNGLEVTCDPCGKGVVVGCGYALSPCGDDIVVCEPVPVDVCALIKACRTAERMTQPCVPPRPGGADGCGGESEWVLAIRYSETPTRGVKPLISTPAACCGCGCAPASCTCKPAPVRKPRTAPVQCEPTVVCEGFEFEVYRKPLQDPCARDDNKPPLALNPDSELYQRLQCCWEMLVERFPRLPEQNDSVSLHRWTCNFKEFLQRYLSSKPGYNCELLMRLNTIVCPPLNQNNPAQIQQILGLLLIVWLDALLSCFCSALLPPCPAPTEDARVPIATFKVDDESCRVLSICNWTTYRKIATTFPALQYWLDLLPFGHNLRCLLDRLCCRPLQPPRQRGDSVPGVAGRMGASHHGAMPDTPGAPGGTPDGAAGGSGGGSGTVIIPDEILELARQRLNPDIGDPGRLAGVGELLGGALARSGRPLEPAILFESFFLPDKLKTAEHLGSAETANLSQFLLLNQIIEPIAATALAPLRGRRPAAARGDDDTAALKDELAKLQARVDEQERKLAAMGRRRRGGG
jgi:hypothetical protein